MAQDNNERVIEINTSWKKFSLGLFLILETHFKNNHYFLLSEQVITPADTNKPYELTRLILRELNNNLIPSHSFEKKDYQFRLPKYALNCGDVFVSYVKENFEFIDRVNNDVTYSKEHKIIIEEICKHLLRWNLEFLNYEGKKSDRSIVQDLSHPANTAISTYALVQRSVKITTATTIPTLSPSAEAGTISLSSSASYTRIRREGRYQKTNVPPTQIFSTSVNQTQFSPPNSFSSDTAVVSSSQGSANQFQKAM